MLTRSLPAMSQHRTSKQQLQTTERKADKCPKSHRLTVVLVLFCSLKNGGLPPKFAFCVFNLFIFILNDRVATYIVAGDNICRRSRHILSPDSTYCRRTDPIVARQHILSPDSSYCRRIAYISPDSIYCRRTEYILAGQHILSPDRT